MKKLIAFNFWSVLLSIGLLLPVFAAENNNDLASRFRSWQMVGPIGGDVRVVTIDPRDANRLYISTLDGQVYTSDDAGNNWSLIANFDRPQLVLDQLMIDERDSNIIYASGHRFKQPGGFFKTSDGGKTWKEAKELNGASIHSMTQSESDPNKIIVGTTEGVWISENSGDAWKKVQSATMPLNVDSLAVDPRNSKTIYAGTWWRAYKSTDGGGNWHLIKDGMIDDSDVFAISLNEKDPDHVIASACSGIYESFNGGEKWAKIQGIPSQSRRTRDIVQHPSIPGTIYAGTTEGFWMSTNGGKSWAVTTQKDLEINSIAVHPDMPNRVFIGTNNYGVMVSNDGGKSFTQTNNNFSSRLTYSVTPDIERPNRLYATTINTATGGGFVFVSDNDGATWRPSVRNFDVNRATAYQLVQDRVNPDIIYLATNFGIFKSIDRAASWNLITVPKPPPAKKTTARRRGKGKAAPKPAPTPISTEPALIPAIGDKINILAHTEDGKNGYLAGTNNGLYRSYDIAKGWEKLSFGENLNTTVTTLYISPLEPETLWVGTATSGVLVSRDNGKTWAAAPTIPQGVPVSAISGNPKKTDYIYVGTTQTFYVSKDGGKSFTRRGGNLPLGNFASILVNPENGKEVFIASALEHSDGLFYSDDAGWSWKRIDSKENNLASRRVWSLTFDPNNSSRIFAGTHSAGIYRIDWVQKAENEQPQEKSDPMARPRISGTVNQ